MKTKYLLAIVAAALLAILASAPVGAQDLEPRSPLDWLPADGGGWPGVGEPAPAGWGTIFDNQPQPGDEDRGVFDLPDLSNGDDPDADSNASFSAGEVTAMFYDLELITRVFRDTGGTAAPDEVELWFGAAGRNPLSGGALGTAAPGTGGVVLFYDEAEPNEQGSRLAVMDPAGGGLGPTSWTEGTGTAPDVFPDINDGGENLWLSGSFIRLGTTLGRPFFLNQTIDLNGGTSTDFQVGIDLVSGSALSSIVRDGIALTGGPGTGRTADIRVRSNADGPNLAPGVTSNYDGTFADGSNWQTFVSDPFTFIASGDIVVAGRTLSATSGNTYTSNQQGVSSLFTPEPGAASLLGIGLLGLLAFRRKKE